MRFIIFSAFIICIFAKPLDPKPIATFIKELIARVPIRNPSPQIITRDPVTKTEEVKTIESSQVSTLEKPTTTIPTITTTITFSAITTIENPTTVLPSTEKPIIVATITENLTTVVTTIVEPSTEITPIVISTVLTETNQEALNIDPDIITSPESIAQDKKMKKPQKNRKKRKRK